MGRNTYGINYSNKITVDINHTTCYFCKLRQINCNNEDSLFCDYCESLGIVEMNSYPCIEKKGVYFRIYYKNNKYHKIKCIKCRNNNISINDSEKNPLYCTNCWYETSNAKYHS